jgi:hypothetical protein
MSAIDDLLTLSAAYQAATGVQDSTLSSRMFNDGKKLAAMKAGGDINVTRYERALQWLSDNWPDKATWPHAIERPIQTVVRATA